MENQNEVIVTPKVSFADIATMLENARNAIVKNAVSTGELIGNYAKAMQYAFDKTLENGEVVKWYDLKGKAKAGVKAEYKSFVDALESAGLGSNKYVYWQRVKEASGYVTAGNKVTANLSVDEKNQKDLMTIINRIYADQEAGGEPKSAEILEDLKFCFSFLGGDVDTLG